MNLNYAMFSILFFYKTIYDYEIAAGKPKLLKLFIKYKYEQLIQNTKIQVLSFSVENE